MVWLFAYTIHKINKIYIFYIIARWGTITREHPRMARLIINTGHDQDEVANVKITPKVGTIVNYYLH